MGLSINEGRNRATQSKFFAITTTCVSGAITAKMATVKQADDLARNVSKRLQSMITGEQLT